MHIGAHTAGCHAGVLQNIAVNGNYEPITQIPSELGKLITALPPIQVGHNIPITVMLDSQRPFPMTTRSKFFLGFDKFSI